MKLHFFLLYKFSTTHKKSDLIQVTSKFLKDCFTNVLQNYSFFWIKNNK